MTKRNKLIVLKGSGLLMEQLFENGTYQEWKKTDNHLEAIKEEMKNRIPEEMDRKHFVEEGVIVRHLKTATYNTDVKELNEYLYNLGILTKVTRFEDIDKIKNFRNPIERYIKFNIGKKGKVEKVSYNFEELTDNQLASLWVKEKNKANELKEIIDEVKNQMLQDEILLNLEEGKRKLECSYGSVSLLDKKRSHDGDAILQEFGSKFVIENSKPNMEDLQGFVIDGYITNKEIDQFRTLVSMGSKFIITTVEDYQKQGEVLDFKRMIQSKNLQELWSYKQQDLFKD